LLDGGAGPDALSFSGTAPEEGHAMTPGSAKICMGCWEQMHVPVPLQGPLAAPFRLFGVRRSRMNPNTCTICELAFSKIMQARSITTEATVLFADLRGYTELAQDWPVERISALLDIFYDECATAIWEQDGLLNKTLGDSVMAIFNFPLKRENHTERAVLAAREMLRRCHERQADLAQQFGGVEVGIGIGIDCGPTNFGEFGKSHRDLTAIGTVVNRASRAQGMAQPGQILVTDAVRDAAPSLVGGSGSAYRLKGFEEPVTLYAA
jgi:adenylate cyclase